MNRVVRACFQAIGRAHRIGQTRPVRVIRLITSSSIEEARGVISVHVYFARRVDEQKCRVECRTQVCRFWSNAITLPVCMRLGNAATSHWKAAAVQYGDGSGNVHGQGF